MVRDLVTEGARRKREHRRLSKEYDRLGKEEDRLFALKKRGSLTQEEFIKQFNPVYDRINTVFKQMDMSEDWMKDYVANLVGNSDEILT